MPGQKHNTHRLRRGRVSRPGQIYLITTATYGRQPIFSDLVLGRCVVHSLRDAHGAARTLAFVVMPDHLHWLMQLQAGPDLSAVIRHVKSRSSHAVQQRLGTQTPVWQRGFHDHALRREEHILNCARYVIANPLRAGLVERVGDYPLWDAQWL
ncbi:transposase [Pseudohalioglobus sediminis]|uniref:Transposase n=1 Tax=Pseudohalioglobus sediminis TaxID=2606449 RepID=A0A5B0WQ97_9GAMM|nr:transposase [Pseudohalioglobus sediminis]KAA1188976.1 transposase [Pseudohalioglobus sediminis]